MLATCLRFRFLVYSISRNRSRTGDADAIEEEPLHEDEEPESDDSFDAKSRMSFSYWCVSKTRLPPVTFSYVLVLTFSCLCVSGVATRWSLSLCRMVDQPLRPTGAVALQPSHKLPRPFLPCPT